MEENRGEPNDPRPNGEQVVEPRDGIMNTAEELTSIVVAMKRTSDTCSYATTDETDS